MRVHFPKLSEFAMECFRNSSILSYSELSSTGVGESTKKPMKISSEICGKSLGTVNWETRRTQESWNKHTLRIATTKELLEKVLEAYPGIPTLAQVQTIANRHEATKRTRKLSNSSLPVPSLFATTERVIRRLKAAEIPAVPMAKCSLLPKRRAQGRIGTTFSDHTRERMIHLKLGLLVADRLPHHVHGAASPVISSGTRNGQHLGRSATIASSS